MEVNIPIVCCLTCAAFGAFTAWMIAHDLGYRKAKAEDSGVVDGLESSLAAAIKERDRIEKSARNIADISDKALNGWAKAADACNHAEDLINEIAALIEQHSAETCGEGEG
jgi:hypothetical protein